MCPLSAITMGFIANNCVKIWQESFFFFISRRWDPNTIAQRKVNNNFYLSAMHWSHSSLYTEPFPCESFLFISAGIQKSSSFILLEISKEIIKIFAWSYDILLYVLLEGSSLLPQFTFFFSRHSFIDFLIFSF